MKRILRIVHVSSIREADKALVNNSVVWIFPDGKHFLITEQTAPDLGSQTVYYHWFQIYVAQNNGEQADIKEVLSNMVRWTPTYKRKLSKVGTRNFCVSFLFIFVPFGWTSIPVTTRLKVLNTWAGINPYSPIPLATLSGLGSAAARLLRLWVRILPAAWGSISCEWCVSLGRGLCEWPITRPEVSYRVWSVWEWSRNFNSAKA